MVRYLKFILRALETRIRNEETSTRTRVTDIAKQISSLEIAKAGRQEEQIGRFGRREEEEEERIKTEDRQAQRRTASNNM